MKRLIYRSSPFGFEESTLAAILLSARRNNRRDGITGALLCRRDLYLQLLEGPELAVDAAYVRIAADDRHCDVKLLTAAAVDARMFPDWEMLDDQMPTLAWSEAEIANGAVDVARPDELLGIFERLAEGVARP